MTARQAALKAAEIARQTARCPRNAVGVARDEISGWFSADQYREEGADAVADALSAFADTLTEGPQTERDAARYRWLRKLYDGVDFEYGEEFGEKYLALIFELPVGMRVSANLDDTLDAAMSADSDRAKDATQE